MDINTNGMFKYINKKTRFRLKTICNNYEKIVVSRKQEKYSKKNPIFILGTQKTGTTAIAALVGKAANKDVTLDLLNSTKDSAWPLKVKYGCQSFTSFVMKHEKDFLRDIVKEPWLTYFYYELQEVFPNSQYVMVMRNPFDTIRSVLNRLGVPGDRETISFSDYRSLRDIKIWRLALNSTWHGKPSEDYISALANRWDISAKIYLDNKDRFRLIRYEDFLKNKETTINDLVKDLGYECKGNIKSHVDTQYQVKGNNKATALEFFGKDNYNKIDAICRANASLLGY